MIKIYSALITDFTQADYTNQYSLLEHAIRDKIDAKKNSRDKIRSLAGYILLYRAVLELYQKTEIKIYFNEHGKPLCDFCFFNISHSEDRVVCVISDQPVGIDIQKVKAIKKRPKYKFFNARENEYVNCDECLFLMHYTEIFTKKEAAVKMLGESILHGCSIDTFSSAFNFETQKSGDFITTVCTQNK